jgi:hypothetical protein
MAPIDFPKVIIDNHEVAGMVINFSATPAGVAIPELPLANTASPSVPIASPSVQLFFGGIIDGLATPPADAEDGPMVLDYVAPDGEYFVMGDNQSQYGSEDSRYFGSIPFMSIAGSATAVIWPIARRGDRNVWLLEIPPTFDVPDFN